MKIGLSRVTRRDGCTIPFKGHNGKTNNESSTVSPPLQTGDKKKKKKLGEFKRLSGIFVIFALYKSAGRESSATTFHTAGLAQGPRAKKGNVLLNVTYWKEDEQTGCKKEENDYDNKE